MLEHGLRSASVIEVDMSILLYEVFRRQWMRRVDNDHYLIAARRDYLANS